MATCSHGGLCGQPLFNSKDNNQRLYLPQQTWRTPSKIALQLRARCKQGISADGILVRDCLQKLSYATGLYRTDIKQHFTVSGTQCLFGMEGKWTLSWGMDGRFYEKYDGQEVTYEWGFDGEHNPWYADNAGRVIALELDDTEICQLAVFVRTGFWLTAKGQDQFDIQIEGENSFEALKQQIGELVLAIHFKDKKVMARITIDACQWLPVSMEMNVLGQIDRWEYKDWRAVALGFDCKFPYSCVHYPAGGGRDSYNVNYSTMNSEGSKTREDQVEMDCLYALPKALLIPRYNKYYPQASLEIGSPPDVKMIRARSGQLLVRPLVDGKDIGYFVLDTGANGLSICPKNAEQLNMEAFGELFITGFDGQVKSRFRRGKTFELGPLKIKSPLFVEVNIDNLVIDIVSIVGVCGFDIFHHYVVKISCKEGCVSLFDHSYYEEKGKEPPKWERIIFLMNLPNVPAKINGQDSILLLDTGAGGVDIIFYSKEEKYLNLQVEGFANIKGINSRGEGHQVHTTLINEVEIAGHSFEQVKAVYLSGGSTQLHLSEYTSGILCMELLTRFTIIFDYPKSRVALVD